MKGIMILAVLILIAASGATAQKPARGNNSSAVRYFYDELKDTPTEISYYGSNNDIIVTNPVDRNITIKAKATQNIIKVEVYSIAGSLQLTEFSSGNNVSINAENLEHGVYLIRIYMENEIITKRIYKA